MVSYFKVYNLVPNYAPTVKSINWGCSKLPSKVGNIEHLMLTWNSCVNILACVVLIGSVIDYPANNLSSNVRPKNKDTIWKVWLTELRFKTAVLIQFTLPNNFSKEICHFHFVLPAMHFDEMWNNYRNNDVYSHLITKLNPFCMKKQTNWTSHVEMRNSVNFYGGR